MRFLPYIFFFLFSFVLNAQNDDYQKHIDSAFSKAYETPNMAQLYLDSIPKPIDVNIKGNQAEYYQVSAIINGKNKEQVKLFQNYFLALKHAKLEKNDDVAGAVSLELFYNIYIIKQDTSAYQYLNDAKKYYTKSNNKNGLVEVMQMPAYIEFSKNNYKKSNELLLKNLEHYKSIEDDAYYYLYALFMITSNHIHLNDFENAHNYFSKLKALKNNKTISATLHNAHLVTLYNCFAHVHLSNKSLDSTLVYLQKGDKLKDIMNEVDVKDHFEFYIDYFDAINNQEAKKNYIDSLRLFQNNLIEKSVDASSQLNEALIDSQIKLSNQSAKQQRNKYLIAALTVGILILILFIIVRYKVIKQKLIDFTKRDEEFTFLKTNQEKLKVKILGLEDYLIEVKKDVKKIAAIEDVKLQREEIKQLYKNIHHNSSTLLTKGENHFELVSELNLEFFNEISNKYPELSHSEIIICYYIFTGFKNKEIAVFLNTSNRAIESKRFRIRKKLNLQGKDLSLFEQLEQVVPD